MLTTNRKTLRVLAADDSAVMRGMMRRLFAEYGPTDFLSQPTMELCGVAHDGVECLEAIAKLKPDVLMLDLEMPRLNGLQVLEQLRREGSTLPVIMFSAHTEAGARLTLSALALGAVDYVTKPSRQRDPKSALQALAEQLLPRIAAAAGTSGRADLPTILQTQESRLSDGPSRKLEVLAIGVSTGGPSALEQILPNLPANFPVPVLIAQHMPKLFTQALAERLDRAGSIPVRQAYEGAVLAPGCIWLAPGGFNMAVEAASESSANREAERRIRLTAQGETNYCTPSVDVLFQSVAEVFSAGTLALVLTGMGDDGLCGARKIHHAGGTILAQDEETSAVWGMPGRIAQSGLASAVLPLSRIAADLTRRASRGGSFGGSKTMAATSVMSARKDAVYGMHGR